MKTTRLFFVAISTLMANYLMAQTNLVPNGNFEQETWVDGTKAQEWQSNSGNGETESWNIAANATYENPTNVSIPEGLKMYYIKCLKATTYDWQTIKKVPGSLMLANGADYILSFKVYSILGSGSVNPTIKVFSEMTKYGWPSVDKTTYTVEPGAWKTITKSFKYYDAAGATGELIHCDLGFILKGNVAGTVFFIDDVKIIADNTSGINDLKTPAVSYYPNPVINTCKINSGDFKTAEIYNLAGVMISKSKLDTNKEIDFTGLNAGCYIVKLSGDTNTTIKVVKD